MHPRRSRPGAYGRRLGVMLVLSLLGIEAASAADPPRVPPVVLTDESGRQVRLYEDLIKGHVVAVNFIFTSCPTVCRPMSAIFSHVQSLLGSRPVRLVSITIDPATDTPRKLAEWKAQFRGGRSWTLLTGSAAQIDDVRRAFGVYTPDRFSHSPTIVIVDDIRGRSTRIDGLARATAIVQAIDALSKVSAEARR